MRFQLQPKKLRYLINILIILTIFALLGASFVLQYLDPDHPSNPMVLKWRYPFIAFYLVFSYFSFYMMGIIGSWYSVSYDGITIRFGLRETIIPWDAIEKIVLQQENTKRITLVIDSESDEKHSGILSGEYHLTKHEQTVDEIERYWENPNIVNL